MWQLLLQNFVDEVARYHDPVILPCHFNLKTILTEIRLSRKKKNKNKIKVKVKNRIH